MGFNIDRLRAVTTADLATDVLSADVAGRSKIQAGYFDSATVTDKFEAASINLDRLNGTFDLEAILAAGNTTGASDIVVSTGQQITGQTNLTLDAVALVEVGTATATAITLGRAGITVTVPGNLIVNGTTTTISTTNLVVTDALIYGNDGGVADSPAGIAWDQGVENDAIVLFNGAAGRFEVGRADTTGGTVVPASLSVFSDLKVANLLLAGTAVTADGALTITSTTATLTLVATGANYIALTTNAVERARIDPNGQLVIGTSIAAAVATPAYNSAVLFSAWSNTEANMQLFSHAAAAITSYNAYRARGSVGAPTTTINGDSVAQWIGWAYVGAAGTGYGVTGRVTTYVDGAPSSTSSPGRLSLETTPAGALLPVEHVRVTSTGQVMVGSSMVGVTPSALHLNQIGANATAVSSLWSAGTGVNPLYSFRNARGTLASPTATQSGDTIGTIEFAARGTSGYLGAAYIIAVATATFGASATARLVFHTVNAGAAADRWTIEAAGHLLAGADNTYDIGAAGATRPRDLHLGRHLVVGGEYQPIILSKTSVDLKTVAATNLYTVPAGRSLVVVDVVVKPTTATAANGDAEGGVGIAAGEDDIFPSQLLAGLNATTQRYKFPSHGVVQVAATGEIVKFGLDVADTGTALVADVYLIGYLI